MADIAFLEEKIKEIQDEMKKVGIWARTTPAWVIRYEQSKHISEKDFSEWLQFIYLPNKRNDLTAHKEINTETYIVPQAMKFFEADISKGKLLRLLIELDSIA